MADAATEKLESAATELGRVRTRFTKLAVWAGKLAVPGGQTDELACDWQMGTCTGSFVYQACLGFRRIIQKRAGEVAVLPDELIDFCCGYFF